MTAQAGPQRLLDVGRGNLGPTRAQAGLDQRQVRDHRAGCLRWIAGCECAHDRLVLVVKDDGPGLSRGKREALTTGVGISNTRSRLMHLYHGDYRFDFEEPPGGGLAVTIVVPFVAAAEAGRSLEGVA